MATGINTTTYNPTFPYCGRVFLCGDTLGIKDVWEAADAYDFVLRNGYSFVNESSTGFNLGDTFETYGTVSPTIQTQPIVGIERNITAGVDQGYYSTEAVGELHPSCDGYALALCFRMLTRAEYARFNPLGNSPTSHGGGYRCQRITVTTFNQVTGQLQVLIDIFADYTWYNTNVGPAQAPASTRTWIIDMTTNPQGLRFGIINNLVMYGKLNANMLTSKSCQALTRFAFEIRKDNNGNPWANQVSAFPFTTAGAIGAVPNFEPTVNPLTGKTMGGAGILGTQLSLFHTGDAITVSGALGGNSRIVTTMPTGALPEMGDTITAAIFGDLRLRARAALGASWPAMTIMGRNFGGVYKPICGHGGRYTETDSPTITNTVTLQVPHGATSFVCIARVRTITSAGVHTLDALLTNPNNAAQQMLFSTISTGNITNDRYVYVNAVLNANMRVTSGTVEGYTLRLQSAKTVARGGQQVELYAADGIKALYIAFYS